MSAAPKNSLSHILTQLRGLIPILFYVRGTTSKLPCVTKRDASLLSGIIPLKLADSGGCVAVENFPLPPFPA